MKLKWHWNEWKYLIIEGTHYRVCIQCGKLQHKVRSKDNEWSGWETIEACELDEKAKTKGPDIKTKQDLKRYIQELKENMA